MADVHPNSDSRHLLAGDSEPESNDVHGGGSQSEDESHRSVKCWSLGPCALICLILTLVLIKEIVAWTRLANCTQQSKAGTMVWGSTLPNATTLQRPSLWSNIFWKEVGVYNTAQPDAAKLGFWTNVDLLFGIFGMYAYSDSSHGGSILLQARRPWGVYFGKRYQVWSCSSGAAYNINEDYWAEPWFQISSPERIFNIIQADSGKLLAVSKHTLEDIWSFREGHWVANMVSPNGTVIATMQQESAANVGWFLFPKWFTLNYHPEVVPNELVSFMAAVYDIDGSKSSTGSRRRR